MIALLSGNLASKTLDKIILDVNGVGYQVSIPLSSYYQLPEQGAATLHIYTYVREDSLQLFGFLTTQEKELFILLLGVSGIGPKVALNILSHMACHELRDCLLREDINQLSTLPGIGKKTAERLILELREKIRKMVAPHSATQLPPEKPSASCASDDALSALIHLGYKEKQASAVLEQLQTSADDSTETILKAALKCLVR